MNIKNTFLLVITILITSCMSQKNKSKEQNPVDTVTKIDTVVKKGEFKALGADKDEHGCIGSSGYTWSVIMNNCIRVWETGIQLKQIDKSAQTTYTASVILAKDEKKAELFIAGEPKSLILNIDSDLTSYTDQKYTLKKKGKGWILSKDNKEIYSN